MNNYAEILGLDLKRLEWVSSKERFEKDFLGQGNYDGMVQVLARKFDVMYCVEVAVYQHFGVDVQHLGGVEKYLKEGLKISLDYFFGDYIEQDENSRFRMLKEPSNENISWFEVYRDGLFLSLLANDSDAEQKLVGYIEPWLPFDESSYLVSVYDNGYHKLLAEYLKEGDIVTTALAGEVENCKKKRPKLLMGCLNAIRNKDAKAFASSLKSFLDYFIKSELGEKITTYFSIEGSILWHVAQRAGIEPTGLTDKQMALIMTRKSLGLAT